MAGTQGQRRESSGRRRVLSWTAGGAAALAGAALSGMRSSERAAAQAAEPLIGSWLLQITGGPDPNEREMISFTSDGIALVTNIPYSPPDPSEGPNASPTYATSGNGAWTKTGERQYRTTFYLIETDGQGRFRDTIKVTSPFIISTDGTALTGTFGFEVRDASGAVLFTLPLDSGSVQGTRITA